MADPDPKVPAETPQFQTPQFETTEVETNLAVEQGLGVGARELSVQHESGEQGTLDRGAELDVEEAEELELEAPGRSASVLDDKAETPSGA